MKLFCIPKIQCYFFNNLKLHNLSINISIINIVTCKNVELFTIKYLLKFKSNKIQKYICFVSVSNKIFISKLLLKTFLVSKMFLLSILTSTNNKWITIVSVKYNINCINNKLFLAKSVMIFFSSYIIIDLCNEYYYLYSWFHNWKWLIISNY